MRSTSRDVPILGPEVSAVLFDVEGTLVDAVPRSLRCWRQTLRSFGHEVRISDLQPYAGMDGHDMLRKLLPDLSKAQRQRLVDAQGESFRANHLLRIRAFAGARQLLSALKRSGRRIGLATDCGSDELRRYLEVAKIADLVDVWCCGDDAKRGKPHPDLARQAVRKLGASPKNAVFVGDTPYDARAASKVKLRTLGLLTGGFTEEELKSAGCTAVFASVGALLRALLEGSGSAKSRRIFDMGRE